MLWMLWDIFLQLLKVNYSYLLEYLRVFDTQAILFLKSMSEKVESVIQIQSRSMSDPTLSDIDFKK